MTWRSAVVIAAVLAVLTGCSTFEARRLGPDDQIADRDGIPYVLTRAEPRLTRTIKDGKPAYEVTIAYVPDPGQRYTLRADPSWIADVDFSLSFDDDGALKTVDAVTTERITPTITALGTVLATSVGFLKTSVKRTEARVPFAATFAKLLTAVGCDDQDVKLELLKLINEVEEEAVLWWTADKSIDRDTTFKSLFYIVTIEQKRCLDKFAETLEAKATVALLPDIGPEGSDPPTKRAVASFAKAVPLYGLAERHAHQVARLQRELDQAILTSSAPEESEDVRAKRDALAKAVGRKTQLEQLRKIERTLAEGPPWPSGRGTNYEEYARMREQAKALRTEIADAVGQALASLAPPALKPFTGIPLPIVDSACIEDLPEGNETNPRDGKNCPGDDVEFVVVFERVPASGMPAQPSGGRQ